MLFPRDTPTRQRLRLDGLWMFSLDRNGVGRQERWWDVMPSRSREMPVPSSYNDVYPDRETHDHVGDVWYQRSVAVPSDWRDRRIVLRFGSATHRATVWVNGQEVAEHEGGYTPFEAEVSRHVRLGEKNTVTVAVNNVLTWQSIPPGYVKETPEGPRQRYFHDFFNYAGLHRSVWLYTTPRAHVRDLTVVTGLRAGTGEIRYEVDAADAEGHDVRATVFDAGRAPVAGAAARSGTLEIADAHPWRPGEGYLYEFEVALWRGDTRVDSYALPIGIRTVEVSGARFLINGEPFYFRGFGRHEDNVVRGKGHDDVMMVHDFALMEWVGANSFRTSHYPYADEVLDYADRRGFVVIAETPAVGMNMGIGGGIFGSQGHTTFSPETVNDTTRDMHAQAIRELIDRDKNHPCVVLWSIANEPESNTAASRAYFEPLAAEARRCDPSRPIGFANEMQAPAHKDVITDLFDVVMLNRYYGWYVNNGDLAGAARALEADLIAWQDTFGKPIIMTEYGGDTLPGLHTLRAEPWSEEYQAELLEMSHHVFDRVDAVVGEQLWSFADFATTSGIVRVDGNKKGVFTRDRRPKAAVHHLRRRWHGPD